MIEENAAKVNLGNSAWTAQAPAKFTDIEDVQVHLGTIMNGKEGFKAKEISDVPNDLESRSTSTSALCSQTVQRSRATSTINPHAEVVGPSATLRPSMTATALPPVARPSSLWKTPL